jgi:predicted CXXCH cytochrome family protein
VRGRAWPVAVLLLTSFALIVRQPAPPAAQETDWADCRACHTVADNLPPPLSALRPEPGRRTVDTCKACHAETFLSTTVSRGVHPVRSVGDHIECSACHTPVAHSAVQPPPVPADYDAEACFACHRNVDGELRLFHAHGPRLGVRCIECHPAHTPLQAALPSDTLPRSRRTMQRFRPQFSNDACTTCHSLTALALTSYAGFTDTARGNLHQLHTNAGSLCIECHAPHGSTQKAMVRLDLLNGDDLVYQALPDGGRCSTSCHGVQHNGIEYRNAL